MAELIATATRTPIGELSPALSAASTRSLRAIVTLIWPYSCSNSSLKVLLAEPDFRLRRTHGQVRVLFTGSSARIVFEAGIGSGDEVLLSLAGVEWVKDEFSAQTNTPGRGIEWDLKYSERLLLQIQQSETGKISLLDIDHPAPEAESTNVFSTSEPEVAIPDPIVTTIERPRLAKTETNEWASPAFIKRARVSYGSLFESGYDLFAEDDGTIQGKGRKRTRFSRESGSWRYSSRSPTPTVKGVDAYMTEANLSELEESKPSMMDEGCQTLDFEVDNPIDRSRSLSAQVPDIEQRNTLQDGTPDQESITQTIKSGHVEVIFDKMPPPPKPNLVLEVGSQTNSDDHEVLEDGAIIAPLSPQLNPVSSDALPLVSPLISSALEPFSGPQLETVEDTKRERGWFEYPDPNVKETFTLDDLTEADDIYGSSPAAPDSRHDAQSLRNVGLSVTNHEGPQIMSFEESHDSTVQYGHWQGEMAAQERTSRPISPNEPENFLKETYPELDVMGTQRNHLQAEPYYGNDRIHSPASTGSHNRQKQTSHGGFAMSRSHSARSEVVDLTEDSDEDAETIEVSDNRRIPNRRGQPKPRDHQDLFVDESDEDPDGEEDGYNLGSSIEGQTDTLQYHEGPYLDESEIDEVNEFSDNTQTSGEQQMAQQYYHEGLIWDESGEEEDEERSYDEEEEIIEESDEDEKDGNYPPGFRSVNDNQSEDQFIEDEEDVSDEEDPGEAGSAVTAIKRPRGEPEVIVLSSDEEDAEDDTISRRSRETIDRNVLKDSVFHSQDESASDIDADAEIEDEEVDDGDEISDDEDSRHETEVNQPEGGIEQRVNHSSSSEPEIEDAEVPNTTLEIVQPSISGVVINEHHPQHHVGNGIGINHTLTRLHDGLGGTDGATDDPMDTEGLYPTLPLDIVTAEMARAGSLPPSPGSIHHEPSSQESRAQRFSHSEYNCQEPVSRETTGQQDFSEDRLDEVCDNGDHVDEKHASVEPVTRESHLQESTSNESMDQLRDILEPSSQVEAGLEDKYSRRIDNQQLPTPEATQLAIGFEPELHFHSNDLAEPSTPSGPTVTSINVKSATDVEMLPSVSMDSPSSPDMYDASAELALSVLESPSKGSQKELPLSNSALRVKLTRPLQTTLGAFTPLKLVRFHLEQKVDVIALVATQPPEPQRAKNGPRHYHVRFNITDASVSPSGVIGAQIFRPFKSALPTMKPGDGILLRNFIVKAEARGGFTLRSDEGSSWVVFKDNNEEEVRGPPVEYEDGEREHVASLKTWFQGLDNRSKERLARANGDAGADGDKRR